MYTINCILYSNAKQFPAPQESPFHTKPLRLCLVWFANCFHLNVISDTKLSLIIKKLFTCTKGVLPYGAVSGEAFVKIEIATKVIKCHRGVVGRCFTLNFILTSTLSATLCCCQQLMAYVFTCQLHLYLAAKLAARWVCGACTRACNKEICNKSVMRNG